MFRKLLNLSLRRTPLQALGFYFAYFVLGVLMSMVGGMLAGIADPSLDYDEGVRVGVYVAVVYVAVLGGLICMAKGPTFLLLLIVVVAMGGAVVMGNLLGLAPIAFMTTLRGSKPAATGVEPGIFD